MNGNEALALIQEKLDSMLEEWDRKGIGSRRTRGAMPEWHTSSERKGTLPEWHTSSERKGTLPEWREALDDLKPHEILPFARLCDNLKGNVSGIDWDSWNITRAWLDYDAACIRLDFNVDESNWRFTAGKTFHGAIPFPRFMVFPRLL